MIKNVLAGLLGLWNRLNPQQKMGLWLALIASGGPFAKLLVHVFDVPSPAVQEIVGWLNYVTPIVAGSEYIRRQSDDAKVEGVKTLPVEKKVEALQAAPDDVKVKVAEAIPDVATVVIKDDANGKLGALAQSEAHPNIVTETQNEKDAKEGTKV